MLVVGGKTSRLTGWYIHEFPAVLGYLKATSIDSGIQDEKVDTTNVLHNPVDEWRDRCEIDEIQQAKLNTLESRSFSYLYKPTSSISVTRRYRNR